MAEINEKVASNVVDETVTSEEEIGFIRGIFEEIIYSPLNLLLVAVIAFLIYKIVKSRSDTHSPSAPPEPELPKLRKDFTIQELKQYDGKQADGRVLVAVNGHVYDVTKGRKFYGPGKYTNTFIYLLTHRCNSRRIPSTFNETSCVCVHVCSVHFSLSSFLSILIDFSFYSIAAAISHEAEWVSCNY